MFCTEWKWKHSLSKFVGCSQGKVWLLMLNQKQPKSLLTKGINKLWHTHAREHHLAMKGANSRFIQKHQWISKTFCWVAFVGNAESKEYISMILFTWSSWKGIYSTVTESLSVVASDLWERWHLGLTMKMHQGNSWVDGNFLYLDHATVIQV